MLRILLTLALLSGAVAPLAAQTAPSGLAQARNLLGTNNCDDALKALRSVTDNDKKNPEYDLLMGRSYDCKKSWEQADYYYSRYLQATPGNDSVKKRSADIKGMIAHNTKAIIAQHKDATEEQKHANKRAKRTRFPVLYRNFGNLGLGYLLGLGEKAPYAQGVGFYVGGGYVLAPRVVLDLDIQSQYMFSMNRPWFRNAFGGVEPASSTGYGGVFSLGCSGALFNTKKHALSLGGFTGAGYFVVGNDGGAPDALPDPSAVSLCYGAKASYYMGHTVSFHLRANMCTTHKIITMQTSSWAGSSSTSVNASFNTISLVVYFRINSQHWW